jgi:hypothetical protein
MQMQIGKNRCCAKPSTEACLSEIQAASWQSTCAGAWNHHCAASAVFVADPIALGPFYEPERLLNERVSHAKRYAPMLFEHGCWPSTGVPTLPAAATAAAIAALAHGYVV